MIVFEYEVVRDLLSGSISFLVGEEDLLELLRVGLEFATWVYHSDIPLGF